MSYENSFMSNFWSILSVHIPIIRDKDSGKLYNTYSDTSDSLFSAIGSL